MSVTAKQLSKSGARGVDIDTLVRDLLSSIDDTLRRAKRAWGRNVVAYEAPPVHNIPGLDKADTQRIVYSSVLKSLERRGFETRLKLDDKRTVFYIAWVTDLEASEVEAMNALIRSKRVAPEEVEEFVHKGSTPAPNAARAVRLGLAPPPPTLVVSDSGAVMQPRGGVSRPRPQPRLASAGPTEAPPTRPSAAEKAILGGDG